MPSLNIQDFPEDLHERLRRRAEAERRPVEEVVIRLLEQHLTSPMHSILELRGLGRELWRDADASQHVEQERRSWDS